MEQTYEYKVAMACTGCSGAVERVLKRTPGVTRYNISLEKQSVSVTGTANEALIRQSIAKTGKAVTKLLPENSM